MISELKKAGLYDENTAYVDKVNDATKVAMALSKLEEMCIRDSQLRQQNRHECG